jgi:hypothetical protein
MKILTSTIMFALWVSGTVLAQDVRYNADPGVDTSRYKTYRWAEHPDSRAVDPVILKQLGQAFDTELAKKGLQRVSGETSDLVIVFQIARGQEKLLTTFTNEYGYGPGWRQVWYTTAGGSHSTQSTMPAQSKIDSGQVVLDMYDTSTKHLIWRGMVSKTLESNVKPEQQKKNIDKAAEKLMDKYPPPKM